MYICIKGAQISSFKIYRTSRNA